jgi:hypothetical protein
VPSGRLIRELTQLGAPAVVEHPNRRHQKGRGLGTAFCSLDRRAQQLVEGKTPETPVQLDPPVDTAGHGHGADVVPERHVAVAFAAECLGVATGPGATAGVEGMDSGAVVHESEQVAAEAAQVWAGDGQHRVGGDGCVHGRSALAQRCDSGRTGPPVGRGDQSGM